MKIDPNFFYAPSHPVADEAAFDTSPDWTKRYADVILVTLSLPVTAPVIGALWLVVRLDGGAGFTAKNAYARMAAPLTVSSCARWCQMRRRDCRTR